MLNHVHSPYLLAPAPMHPVRCVLRRREGLGPIDLSEPVLQEMRNADRP